LKDRSALLRTPLLTTVVGSHPVGPINHELMEGYRDTEYDPYLGHIRDAVTDQVEAGVMLISDGQVRTDMIDQFLLGLYGVRRHKRPVVNGPLERREPVRLDDAKFVKELMDEISPDTFFKGIVTGPWTLAKSVHDDHYKNQCELAYRFAELQNEELLALEPYVDVLSVDEPYLSVEFPEEAADIFTQTIKGVELPVSLHVCGDIEGIFPKLTEFGADVLDHEFSESPSRLGAVLDHDFEANLGLGVVSSSNMEVETIEEIEGTMKMAVGKLGAERVWVDPDCGLRYLTREVATKKLLNIRDARESVLDSLA